LMAFDGYTEDLPDTPENARAFGRPTTDRGASAYPQVRCVVLCELGTHCIVDASFSPLSRGEEGSAWRLCRSLTEGMLLLWDRGFHAYALLRRVREQGAHVLGRLPAHVELQRVRQLADGSWLARLPDPDRTRRRQGEHLLVRLIEYTFNDPALPGHGQRYRLVTTLLEPEPYSADALACLYHERWEVELVIDEQETHQLQQHLPASPLRSRKPGAPRAWGDPGVVWLAAGALRDPLPDA
jgi:hypothetical protein